MVSDKQLLDLDAVEGRTLDRSEAQLGELQQAKSQFNEARQEAMKTASYHPAIWNRPQWGITG